MAYDDPSKTNIAKMKHPFSSMPPVKRLLSAHGQEVYAVLFFLLVFSSRTQLSARGEAAGSMPRYDARPAGSFRSSLRSDPRYDVREPPDDGDSGPGSDVTES